MESSWSWIELFESIFADTFTKRAIGLLQQPTKVRTMKTQLEPMFRMPSDPADTMSDCLADSQGFPLRFDPNNHPAPPHGDGVQLEYRALPHYEGTLANRQQACRTQITQFERRLKHLEGTQKALKKRGQPFPDKDKQELDNIKNRALGKNQPIKITNEHELAFIFLQEFYKKESGCNIPKLDPGAILNIMTKASCFSNEMREQTKKVRDEVRNSWAHAVIENWDQIKLNAAFMEMYKLAQLVPDNQNLLMELDEDWKGAKTNGNNKTMSADEKSEKAFF